jgi:acyl dehydratase
MAVTQEELMGARFPDGRVSYTEREAILYALSVGMARDPLNADELPFVFEGLGLKALPTLAVVLVPSGLPARLGVAGAKIVHFRQQLVLHRSLPSAGAISTRSRVSGAHDRGTGKGAVISIETTARLDDGDDVFTSTMTILARGDGGYGGPVGGAPALPAIPDRAPDIVVVDEVRPDAALLYRLNSDRNPLHADPAAAAQAGFERPILHGLCTYAIAGRAILSRICGYDTSRLKSIDARFSSPVFPGDVVTTQLWQDSGSVSFRCLVEAREAKVIDNGLCHVV